MPDHQHPVNDSSHLDPQLKQFIERVIVPILVKEYLGTIAKASITKRADDRTAKLPL